MPHTRRLQTVLILCLCLLAAACARHDLRVDAVRPSAQRVITQHDQYVVADTSLTDAESQSATAQSARVLSKLSAAVADGDDMIDGRSIEADLRAVTTRHDAYVMGDDGLSPLQRRVRLRQSLLLRRLFDQMRRDPQPLPPPTTQPATQPS